MRTRIKTLLQNKQNKQDKENERKDPSLKNPVQQQKVIEIPVDEKVSNKPGDKPVMQSMASPGQKDGMLMTTYTTQKGKKVLMPRIWTVANFGKNILAHNTTSMVTNVVIIGKTGSGKTVCAKRIIHDIHTRGQGKGYVIKWFSEEDMLNLKNILPKLSKNRNYIMIWDDISFVEKKYGLNQKDTAELASLMATLRHKYLSETSHLINFSLIHYTKAVGKGTGFRQGDFTVATSVTQNEKMNFYELFDKYVLDNFAKMYRLGLLKGKFSIAADAWSDKTYDYYIKDVHPVLVNEINHPHPMLVDMINCEICGQDRYSKGIKRITTAEEFIEKLPKTTTAQQGRALRWWAYIKTGNDRMLRPADRWTMRLLDRTAQDMDIPVEEILDTLYEKKHSDTEGTFMENRGRTRKYRGNAKGIKSDGVEESFKYFEKRGKLKGKAVPVKDYLTNRITQLQEQLQGLNRTSPVSEENGENEREQENTEV